MVSKLQYNKLSNEQLLHLARNNLAWYLCQPSLVDVDDLGAQTHAQEFLDDIDPQALDARLAETNSHFLGPYIEQLWSYYIQASKRYELVANNLQVNTPEKTIGEFDFIIKDTQTGQFIHQEIAIKFYLGLPVHNEGQTRWFGPNRIDRLDKKAAHLRSKQLQLSEIAPAKSKLLELGILEIEKQAILRGRLFLPWNDGVRASLFDNQHTEQTNLSGQALAPPILHASDISGHAGRWLKVSELKAYLSTKHSETIYYVLDKLQWLSLDDKECTPYSEEQVTSFAFQHVGIEGRAMLIKANDEEVPVFIVAEHWPQKCYDSLTPDAL